jgi:hypothetical protein
MSIKSDHISNGRALAGRVVLALRTIRDLAEEYNTLSLGASDANAITDADMTGENAEITAAQYHAAITALTDLAAALTAPKRAAIFKIKK